MLIGAGSPWVSNTVGDTMSSTQPKSSSTAAKETVTQPEEESPRVVWSTKDRSRSLSRAGSGRSAIKRSGAVSKGGEKSAPPEKKKKKRNTYYNFKINIYYKEAGQNVPISLANWRIMNVQLCALAATKVRQMGPPQGGVGQKHWQEHSDGTRKTSELPETERFGHTVIRFSTIEAQEWYKPLVDQVLGTAQDGSEIKLGTEIESDDKRARYVFSLPAADFTAFGNSKEERASVLKHCILGALGITLDSDLAKSCDMYSSFLFEDKGRDNLWKVGFKFPPLVETQMDSALKGEKFGVLPTAITGVRVLKKQNSTTLEEELSRAMRKTALAPTGGSNRSRSRDSKRGRSSSGCSPGPENAPKKIADGPSPDKTD